jgi:hypothetical protein
VQVSLHGAFKKKVASEPHHRKELCGCYILTYNGHARLKTVKNYLFQGKAAANKGQLEICEGIWQEFSCRARNCPEFAKTVHQITSTSFFSPTLFPWKLLKTDRQTPPPITAFLTFFLPTKIF